MTEGGLCPSLAASYFRANAPRVDPTRCTTPQPSRVIKSIVLFHGYSSNCTRTLGCPAPAPCTFFSRILRAKLLHYLLVLASCQRYCDSATGMICSGFLPSRKTIPDKVGCVLEPQLCVIRWRVMGLLSSPSSLSIHFFPFSGFSSYTPLISLTGLFRIHRQLT
jgi:hypothetical protein